jgi:hypothetical protein
MKGWKAAMPDVRGTVTDAVEGGQRVVLEVMWEGTQTGEMVTEQGTIPASGKRQKTPAAFIFDYENGKLKESRHYFDMLTFLSKSEPHKTDVPQAWRRIRGVKHLIACALTLHFCRWSLSCGHRCCLTPGGGDP